MITVLVATRNEHKVGEIGQLLGRNFRCLTMKEFPSAPVALEQADTFAGNATAKVVSLAKWLTKNPEAIFQKVDVEQPVYVVADDSGLEVDALGGAPGVRSARFAADDAPGSANAPDSANNAKLLRLLEGKPTAQRTARFRCVLAAIRLLTPSLSRRVLPFTQNQIVLFDGVCEGRISNGAAGQGGFGYDPLFVPNGCDQSFAELGDKYKNQLSHRAQAVKKFKDFTAKAR